MRVRGTATWVSVIDFDTDDYPEVDWSGFDVERLNRSLNEWPKETLDEINASAAELTDWEVS